MYNIDVYKGVGDIRFGMTSEEIQKIMGVVPEKIQKYNCEYLTDSYHDFNVYYKKPGICEALEFIYYTELPLIYQGEDLFKMNYSEIKKYILKYDSNTEEEDYGFTSYKLGIGVYAPDMDENPKCLVEGIIVFEEGYYD